MYSLKPLESLTLQDYEKAKKSGMLWEYHPHATGNINQDLQAVVVKQSKRDAFMTNRDCEGYLIGYDVYNVTVYTYDIIDEEAEYE